MGGSTVCGADGTHPAPGCASPTGGGESLRRPMQEVLTLKEAAKYLRLSRGKVLALAREGRMPAAKLAGKWRFSRRLLRRWVEDKSEDRALARAAEEALKDPDNQKRIPLEQVRAELGL